VQQAGVLLLPATCPCCTDAISDGVRMACASGEYSCVSCAHTLADMKVYDLLPYRWA
jgi:hypothetical protein